MKKGSTPYFCLPFSQAFGGSVLLERSTCPGGGIGRRVGLKHQWGNPCGFESHPGYFYAINGLLARFCLISPQLSPKFSHERERCKTVKNWIYLRSTQFSRGKKEVVLDLLGLGSFQRKAHREEILQNPWKKCQGKKEGCPKHHTPIEHPTLKKTPPRTMRSSFRKLRWYG